MTTHIITYLHRCRRCLCEWRASYAEARCPRCNGADVRVDIQLSANDEKKGMRDERI